MKLRHKLYLLLGIVTLAAGFSITLYYKTLLPIRSGHIHIKSLSADVRVDFDGFGVPHINAENQLDALRALGFLQAQDRLFQMEMLRRIGYGKLSEVAGPKTIESDKFFLSIDLPSFAKKRIALLEKTNPEIIEKTKAFLDGINQYQDLGPRPLEFNLMGIPTRKFTIEDIYVILGYMSYSFDKAFKTDILLTELKKTVSDKYTKDLFLHNSSELTAAKGLSETLKRSLASVEKALEPFPSWDGSNAWLIGKDKSASGSAIFANDTHVATSTPAVWWEARVSYPGYDTHGYFIAGIPYSVLGDTPEHSWGITIFHKDSTSFIKENVVDDKFIIRGEESFKISKRSLSFKVKGHKNYKFDAFSSELGPLLKDGFSENNKSYPVSLSWDYLREDNAILRGLYIISHARNKDELKAGASQIMSPGLNLFFADKNGDIEHLTTGRIIDFEGQNPAFVMEPPKSKAFPRSRFSDNPSESNPQFGIIYNANQQPYQGVDGYYEYPSRYRVIADFFHNKPSFSLEDSKNLQLSTKISYKDIVLGEILPILNKKTKGLKSYQKEALTVLSSWDGDSKTDSVGASIFYELLSFIGLNLFNDEFAANDISKFQDTPIYLGTLINIIKNQTSPWWDNSHTSYVETMDDVVFNSFLAATENLVVYHGRNTDNWKWREFHIYKPKHPLGLVKPLNHLFNLSSQGVGGGLESPNGFRFLLQPGVKEVKGGAAVRRIRDFAKPGKIHTIIPGGQSGNVFDKHYADQYQLFLDGQYRVYDMYSKAKPESTLKFTK